MSILTFSDFEEYVPHRYENMLIDELDDSPENDTYNGIMTIKIAEDDPYNRNIFLKNKTADKPVIMSPVIMEMLALGSIISTDKVPKDKLAVYAAISNFVLHQDFNANETAKGFLIQQRGKTDFIRYQGELKNEAGETIAQGAMMAFVTTVTESDKQIRKQLELPPTNCNIPIKKNPQLKREDMFVGDTIVLNDFNNGSFMTEYTYPNNHPLTKGHFPQRPVFMGVMQWVGIEDAISAIGQLLKESNQAGQFEVTTNAVIYKKDGTVVSEIKGVKAHLYVDKEDIINQADIYETKKVVFRDMVLPGDSIFISLEGLTIS